MISKLSSVVRYIINHPLNHGRRLEALGSFAAWQIGSRIIRNKIVVPWVDDSRFIVGLGEAGLTGNLYAGFLEFEDMSFVLHALRPSDVFLDVGANAGAFSILASKVVGARSIAFEPIPSTFERLLDQIHVNRIEQLVTARNVGVGATEGRLWFTTTEDTVNRVSIGSNRADAVEVPVVTLDSLLGHEPQRYFLKLDVEGYERQALEGANRLLASGNVFAIIVEINGSGLAFGHPDDEVHDMLRGHGFQPIEYEPFSRELKQIASFHSSGNTVYVRDIREVSTLCAKAPKRVVHTAHGKSI